MLLCKRAPKLSSYTQYLPLSQRLKVEKEAEHAEIKTLTLIAWKSFSLLSFLLSTEPVWAAFQYSFLYCEAWRAVFLKLNIGTLHWAKLQLFASPEYLNQWEIITYGDLLVLSSDPNITCKFHIMFRFISALSMLSRDFSSAGFCRSVFSCSVFLPKMWPMAAQATGLLPGPRRSSSTVRQSSWNIALPAKSSDRHVPPTAASVTTVWVSSTVCSKVVAFFFLHEFVGRNQNCHQTHPNTWQKDSIFKSNIVLPKGFQTLFY